MVGFKDAFKLLGVTVVAFCAVFVCTFFLNFCLDAKSIESLIVDREIEILYKAQMATAKLTCAISGGFLAAIAAVLLLFYTKLYIDRNQCRLGIFKAMGYGDGKIALGFCVFGASVFLGTALGFGAGYCIMPQVYKGMTISGLPEIRIGFHVVLPVALIVLPTAVFSVLVCAYAYVKLRRPPLEMLRGTEKATKRNKARKEKERPFLQEMRAATVSQKKTVAFLVAFAGFCVAAMVQMSVSMNDLAPDTMMGAIIFGIGVVLALTTLFMAITSLVHANKKNISVMKAFGYSLTECFSSVFSLYRIFAYIGFAVGTVYQYGLLRLMVDLVYKDVGAVPEYRFDWIVLLVVAFAFALLYEAAMGLCMYRLQKISLKEVMTEN